MSIPELRYYYRNVVEAQELRSDTALLGQMVNSCMEMNRAHVSEISHLKQALHQKDISIGILRGHNLKLGMEATKQGVKVKRLQQLSLILGSTTAILTGILLIR